MNRWQLINWFIFEYSYRRYLEIGIDNPANCFDRIRAESKTGVDPNKNTTYRMTSDDFFARNTEKFDIVFIDGLHEAEQVIRDVNNALAVLNENGTIIMHDCTPYSAEVAAPKRGFTKAWYGNVWQAWAHFRASRRDLKMHVYPQDCGCGIIQRGYQLPYLGPYDTWDDFQRNRNEILQAIDGAQLVTEFGPSYG